MSGQAAAMSLRVKISFLLVPVLLLVWWVWPAGGEEGAIKGRLDDLVDLVEKSGSESTLEAAGRGRKLSEFFADGAAIEYLPGRSLRVEGEQAAGAFLQARSMAEAISIFIMSHQVEVDESGESARSKVRATAGVTLSGGETESETLTHGLSWEKIEGEWRIREAEVLGE